jgi:DHA2 family multidrug resistance protein
MQHSFQAKGMTSDVALGSTHKSLEYSVYKQAAVLSYMDVFFYLGIIFLICVPFVLMVKSKKKQEKLELSEAMH